MKETETAFRLTMTAPFEIHTTMTFAVYIKKSSWPSRCFWWGSLVLINNRDNTVRITRCFWKRWISRTVSHSSSLHFLPADKLFTWMHFSFWTRWRQCGILIRFCYTYQCCHCCPRKWFSECKCSSRHWHRHHFSMGCSKRIAHRSTRLAQQFRCFSAIRLDHCHCYCTSYHEFRTSCSSWCFHIYIQQYRLFVFICVLHRYSFDIILILWLWR